MLSTKGSNGKICCWEAVQRQKRIWRRIEHRRRKRIVPHPTANTPVIKTAEIAARKLPMPAAWIQFGFIRFLQLLCSDPNQALASRHVVERRQLGAFSKTKGCPNQKHRSISSAFVPPGKQNSSEMLSLCTTPVNLKIIPRPMACSLRTSPLQELNNFYR